MTNAIRIGIVGLGKISREQHIPAILASDDYEIAFTADRAVKFDCDAPAFGSLKEALDSEVTFDAVALCTSPQPRFELFEQLHARTCAILLEKPPAASLNQAMRISELARVQGRCLMTAWHSQFAPGIPIAKEWLQNNRLKYGSIVWRENAQIWHPGQGWLWQQGGYGVFDPGMNALSILTKLMSRKWQVRDSTMTIPANVETPISASFKLIDNSVWIDAAFEFHDAIEDQWDIALVSESDRLLRLSQGGETVEIDGVMIPTPPSEEYRMIYRRFAELVRNRVSEIDLAPLEMIHGVFNNAKVLSTDPIVY